MPAPPPSPPLPVSIDPSDADAVASGYQIDLNEGANTITVTVGPSDGNETLVYTVTVDRALAATYVWSTLPHSEALAPSNPDARAIWSDGTTAWVANWAGHLFAYDLASMARDPAKDITGPYDSFNLYVGGLWSDGEVIWATDAAESHIVFAYDLDTGQEIQQGRLWAIGIVGPNGLWSDGKYLWIAEREYPEIGVILLNGGGTTSKSRDLEIDTLAEAGNLNPRGLWSDGATLWVVDDSDDKIYAYELHSGARQPGRDLDALTAAGNHDPWGLWSDGATIWVSDPVTDRLYAYAIPPSAYLASLEVAGVDIGAFRPHKTRYEAEAPITLTRTTVTAVAAFADSAVVEISPADADTGTPGHQVDLAPGDNIVTVTVTNGALTETYTAVVTVNTPGG